MNYVHQSTLTSATQQDSEKMGGGGAGENGPCVQVSFFRLERILIHLLCVPVVLNVLEPFLMIANSTRTVEA